MKTFVKTLVVTTLICTCIFTPAFAWWNNVQDNTVFKESEVNLEEEMPSLVDEDSPFFQAFSDANRINILLLGVNSGLADTIMLCSYDKDTDNIDLISIPRDTYYVRSGHGHPSEKKINASYQDGALGVAMAVSDLLEGIPINCYMKVDYEGVARIVDSMGGVPMNVPFHMHYTDIYDTPPLYIDIEEGYQVLDGQKAMQFIRFRKGDKGYPGYREGDIGRVKTQQEFMKSAFRQAMGLNIVKVTKSVLNNVESDVKVDTVLSIAKNATGLSPDKVTTYTIPGEARIGEGDLSFWYSSKSQIRDMLTQIYSNQLDEENMDFSDVDSKSTSETEGTTE